MTAKEAYKLNLGDRLFTYITVHSCLLRIQNKDGLIHSQLRKTWVESPMSKSHLRLLLLYYYYLVYHC